MSIVTIEPDGWSYSEVVGITPFPKVLNKYKLQPGETGIYCGRGSPWGNPYSMRQGEDATKERDRVCDLFDQYVVQRPDLIERAKVELKGNDLICFCAPKRCHCDTWVRLANLEE